MPLTEADLDARICKGCRESLREHCTEVEGAWYYSPCRELLLLAGSPEWREQVNQFGRCDNCSRPIEAHFILWTPQVKVRLADGSEADVIAGGPIVVRAIAGFMDCRLSPDEWLR